MDHEEKLAEAQHQFPDTASVRVVDTSAHPGNVDTTTASAQQSDHAVAHEDRHIAQTDSPTVQVEQTVVASAHQHVQPGEPQVVQEEVHGAHLQAMQEELPHELQQGEVIQHGEAQITDEAKENVQVEQHQVQNEVQHEDADHNENVQQAAQEVVQHHQQDDGIQTHPQEMAEHHVAHDQERPPELDQEQEHEQEHEQQPVEGDEVQHAHHHEHMQPQGEVPAAEHGRPEKMEVEMQQPIQEPGQQLEQEQGQEQEQEQEQQQQQEQEQEQEQEHVELHMQAQQTSQEQYQEHVPAEHHEQTEEQLEQQQLQSQEQLEEHHQEHVQGQVQEDQGADHEQVGQAQEVQERHDTEQQQMNSAALATATAAANLPAASSEKLTYEQVEHPVYHQSPVVHPPDALGRGQGSSPGAASRRGAERYHASGEQLRTLVDAFDQDPTPSVQTLNFLSSSIGMPMHNLVLWFKNRRARHKKTHPNQPLKTGRRSYVKSGIYSRAKRAKQQQDQPHATSVGLPTSIQQATHAQLTHGVILSTDPLEGQAVPDLPVDQKQEMQSAMESHVVGGKRTPEEHGLVGPTVSKRAKYAGVKELIGEENPCRMWDGQECHRRCIDFFERMSGGCQLEQTNAARVISAEFFLSELQSGLTMTSAMQPLEVSVATLDNIMDKLPLEGPKLSSGSRVILREFFAQIRSGTAASLQATVNMEIEGVNETRNMDGENPPEAHAGGETTVEEHPPANEAGVPLAAGPEEQQAQ